MVIVLGVIFLVLIGLGFVVLNKSQQVGEIELRTPPLKCAEYKSISGGEAIKYCATCGDKKCEAKEICSSSSPNTFDCGPLYCPTDCPAPSPVSDQL